MATAIQGVNYKFVDSLLDDNYDIIPFDFYGNPLSEMIIAVSTNNGQRIDLNLPEISSFNKIYGTTIKVILQDYDNDLRINANGSDTIGSNTNVTIDSEGANAIFTAVNDTTWSVLITL